MKINTVKVATIKRRTVLGLSGCFVLGAAGAAAGCDKVLPVIAKIGNVADTVRKWIALLEGAIPAVDLSEDTEATVREVVATAKDALAALEEIGKAAKSTDDADYVAAKDALQAAYENLLKVAERLGILTALSEVAAGDSKGERVGTSEELAEMLAE